MFKVSNEEINIHSNIIFQRIWVTEHPIPLKCLQVLSNMRSYAYACVSSGFQLECKNNYTACSWKASLHCAQACVASGFHLECKSICIVHNCKVSFHCAQACVASDFQLDCKRICILCNGKVFVHCAQACVSLSCRLQCWSICTACNWKFSSHFHCEHAHGFSGYQM